MSDEKYYAVEILPKDRNEAVSAVTIPASGPLEAAQQALGAVVTNRRQAYGLSVRVWEVRDEFTTSSVGLVIPTKSAADLKGKTKGADGMNVHKWIALVCTVAVAATSLVIAWSGAMTAG